MSAERPPHGPSKRIALVAGYLVLAAVFLHLVVQNWFLCDDAFISFRYVRNLVEGRGLVFNAGERVEGYTNFLWVLELAASWSWFGVRPEQGALWLSALCTVGVLLITAKLAGTTPFRRHRELVRWMALALVVTNSSFAVWTSSGLETRQFTFLVVLAIWLFWSHRLGDRYLAGGAVAMAGAALTRPEGVLLWGCCVAWLVAVTRGRPGVRSLSLATLPFIVLVGAHFLFRFAYYGEWLPNTYYAKFVSPWYQAGFRYFVQVSIETGLYLLVPLALVGLRARWARADGLHLLSAACIAPHAVYVCRLGGDHFEYRPLDFYWPLLAIAAADGLMRLGQVVHAGVRRYVRSATEAAWTAVAFAVVSVYASSIGWTVTRLTRDMRSKQEAKYVPIARENAPWLLHLPLMTTLTSIFNSTSEFGAKRLIGVRKQSHKIFADKLISSWKPHEAATRGVFPEDALTATGSVGIASFYLPDLAVVDTNGLTDRVIARNPVASAIRKMAHERAPPPGYLAERGYNIRLRRPTTSASAAMRSAAYALPLDGGRAWVPFDVIDRGWGRTWFASRGVVPHHYFAPDDPRGNEVELNGVLLVGRRFLGRFEGSPEGERWSLTGGFRLEEDHPRAGGYVGHALLTSEHGLGSDKASGTATSPPFVVEPDTYLIMLVAGRGDDAGVRLRAGARTLVSSHDPGSVFWLRVVSWPLDAFVGEDVRVEAFDHDAHGFVLLDHVLIAGPKERRSPWPVDPGQKAEAR